MKRFQRILAYPRVRAVLAAITLARLPEAMYGLALLLFVHHHTGSFAVAGLADGSMALAFALTMPVKARVVDRAGYGSALPLAILCAAALAVLCLAGVADQPPWILVSLAALIGATIPPLSPMLRMQWPALLQEDRDALAGAFALDIVLLELGFVVGPILTIMAVAVGGEAAPLVLGAALCLTGTTWLVAALGEPAHAGRKPGQTQAIFDLGALRYPGIAVLAAATIAVGFCFGTIEVAIPAFSASHGSSYLSGLLLGLWAAASLIGGLLYGARRSIRGVDRMHLRLACILPFAYLPFIWANTPVLMAAAALIGGAANAPIMASRNELIAVLAPQHVAAEAFAWGLTSIIVGVSAGAAAAGVITESAGPNAAALAGTASAALAAVIVVLGRRTLREPTPIFH